MFCYKELCDRQSHKEGDKHSYQQLYEGISFIHYSLVNLNVFSTSSLFFSPSFHEALTSISDNPAAGVSFLMLHLHCISGVSIVVHSPLPASTFGVPFSCSICAFDIWTAECDLFPVIIPFSPMISIPLIPNMPIVNIVRAIMTSIRVKPLFKLTVITTYFHPISISL